MKHLKPVVPAGLEEPGDVPLLLGACLVIGALVGAIGWGIGQFIWLLIIFPMAMGFGVGIAGGAVVKNRRVRAPLVAMACAFLGGVVAWSMDINIGYVQMRGAITDDLTAYGETLQADTGVTPTPDAIAMATDHLLVAWGAGRDDDALVDAEIAAILIQAPITVGELPETAPPPPVGKLASFEGFVRFRLSLGTSIGQVGQDGTPVGPTGTLALWIVELLLCAGLAAFMAREAAMQPSCRACKEWYSDEVFATVLGVAPRASTFVEPLDRGEIPTLVEGLPLPPGTANFSALMARHCPKCDDAPVYVEATAFTQSKKGTENKALKRGLLDHRYYAEILEAAAAKEAAAAEASEPGDREASLG